ncbi:MAG TPA: ATP-binding cassette domain-containing protein, partial [Nitrososphaeraceae archaeon]|nr:ATP-binding cassette domain-containing protein [Nitrososphaeraceae archaeon]
MAIEESIETREVEGTRPKAIEKYKVRLENVNVWYGTKRAVKDINLNVRDKSVTAFIGPSGCGKTTLLRCLNRMHELTPGARAEGK